MPNHPSSILNPVVTPTGPCAFVIFGAAGDLTKRKLIPALYRLALAGYLNDRFSVIGFARNNMSRDDFRKKMTEDVQTYGNGFIKTEVWDRFLERLYYVQGDFNDPAAFLRLKETLDHVEKDHGTCGNILFYFATLPNLFSTIADRIGECGLNRQKDGRWRRIVVEKPFGHDLDSAKALNQHLKQSLDEEQIYRIDHYLGKETVQNILAFRFGNTAYEPVWNQQYIDHVAITVSEELGVEQRGPFYETAGALRDMIPNHLLQLLALTAMEPPSSLNAEDIRDEKSKVFRSIRVMTPEDVEKNAVRGQYGDGMLNGSSVAGYRSENAVAKDSKRETFVALKLQVDNWRWGKVPFYLRTGKRLAKRVTQIVVQFKCPPFHLFKNSESRPMPPNTLVIGIQPVEGIQFTFLAKSPGPGYHLGDVSMDFNYCDRFGCELNTGYETLLYDCLIGDATQFQREDMTESSWAVVQPILDVWEKVPPKDFPNYAAGSEGPTAANDLMARDGRHWKPLD